MAPQKTGNAAAVEMRPSDDPAEWIPLLKSEASKLQEGYYKWFMEVPVNPEDKDAERIQWTPRWKLTMEAGGGRQRGEARSEATGRWKLQQDGVTATCGNGRNVRCQRAMSDPQMRW